MAVLDNSAGSNGWHGFQKEYGVKNFSQLTPEQQFEYSTNYYTNNPYTNSTQAGGLSGSVIQKPGGTYIPYDGSGFGFEGVSNTVQAMTGDTFKPNGGLPTMGLAASAAGGANKVPGWFDVTGPGGSKFSNTAAGVGNIASAAGSLYGIYATDKNLKRQEKNDEYLKGRDAQADARMQTFAKNAGGSY